MVLALLAAALVLPTAQALETHDPIHVQGDADLAATADAEGWPGDGTATDPYVIEGFFVEANGTDAIRIENTTDHLLIRDDLVTTDPTHDGIALVNVTNVTVAENTVEDAHEAIVVRRSTDVVVSSNTARGNERAGIAVVGSEDVEVRDNEASLNRDGIRVTGNAFFGWTSRNVRVADNRAEANAECGISLSRDSEGSVVRDNTALGNRVGICLTSTGDHLIVGNSAPDNRAFGIALWEGHDNVIRDNEAEGDIAGYRLLRSSNNSLIRNEASTFDGASDYGIRLSLAPDNLLRRNSIVDVGTGISLRSSPGTRVERTIVVGVHEDGIRVSGSSGVLLQRNWISSAGDDGIEARGASNLTIRSPVIYRADSDGINLDWAPNTTVVDAALSQTWSGTGINARDTPDLVVRNSSIRANTAVRVFDGDRPRIVGNDLQGSLWRGIYLLYADDGVVAHNVINGSYVGLRMVEASGHLVYDNLFGSGLDYAVWLEDSHANQWYREPVRRTNVVGGTWTAGNYWAEYTGADADGDGLGDVPHPVGRSLDAAASSRIDRYPLMLEPVQV